MYYVQYYVELISRKDLTTFLSAPIPRPKVPLSFQLDVAFHSLGLAFAATGGSRNLDGPEGSPRILPSSSWKG